MSGVSRRANSVWTGHATGPTPNEQRISHVESFYAARGLPPTFQVGGQSEPAGLDGMLAERGYEMDAPVSVQVARARDVAELETSSGVRVEVHDRLHEGWFDLSARQGRFAGSEAVYRGLLTRLGDSARFALAFVDECPAGVGLGVASARWLGISSMFTLPTFRNRGAARAILSALAGSAPGERELSLYLQVERDNALALATYARAGFVDHHGYHYRIGSPQR